MHEPSLSYRRPRFGCFDGTVRRPILSPEGWLYPPHPTRAARCAEPGLCPRRCRCHSESPLSGDSHSGHTQRQGAQCCGSTHLRRACTLERISVFLLAGRRSGRRCARSADTFPERNRLPAGDAQGLQVSLGNVLQDLLLK